MNRKNYIKKTIAAGVAGIGIPTVLYANRSEYKSTYDKLMDRVGFNHLPKPEFDSSL